MRTLIILTLILGINYCTAQSESESENKLIGKWILVGESTFIPDGIEPLKENKSESDKQSDSKKKLQTTLIFNKDKTIFINQKGNEYDANYKLSDSILTIGNRNYILIEINEKKLVYKNKDELIDKHYFYKKIK